MTVSIGTTTPVGTYELALKGTSGSLARTAHVTLVVPSPDFALLASPAAASVYQTETASYTISLQSRYGFASTVSLAVAGVPLGTSFKLGSSSISGTKTSLLTVVPSRSTPAGTYELTITGTSGSISHSTVVSLSVAIPVPYFALTITPTASSVSYGRATSITYKIGVVPKFGFSGPVTFTVSGVPAGRAAPSPPRPSPSPRRAPSTPTTSSRSPLGHQSGRRRSRSAPAAARSSARSRAA
jgi:hypothetical protein